MPTHIKNRSYTKLDFKDSADQRRRNGPRQPAPNDEIRPLNETHIRILEFIHLFGGFTTSQLVHEFCKLEGITKQTAITYVRDKLLKEAMYHNHGVIEKPEEQFVVRNMYGSSNRMNHSQYLVYRISEKGERLLKEVGRWNQHAPRAHGWYKHQMMTACTYQIFYLSARKAGIRFTPQHELKPKDSFILLPPELRVFPDAVFVLHLKQPFLFFFEMDRGTEKGSRKAKRKTWGKGIKYYKRIIQEKLYLENYELPEDHRAFLMAMTTDTTMARRILQDIEQEYQSECFEMLVHATRSFGPLPSDFYPPRMYNILDVLWDRHNCQAIKFSRHN